MRTLLLGRKMKATDAKTIQEIGIPSMVLMERAAMAVAAEAEKAAKKDEIVWAVCGSGNNGADGIAAARMLHFKKAIPYAFIWQGMKTEEQWN